MVLYFIPMSTIFHVHFNHWKEFVPFERPTHWWLKITTKKQLQLFGGLKFKV